MYKFLLNALPILIPALNPSKPSRHVIPDSPFDDDNLEAGPTALHPTSMLEVPVARRTARLSLSAQAQLIFLRKRTRRWHAALAGALASGMAIMWEKRSRRGIIAQQLFVRFVSFCMWCLEVLKTCLFAFAVDYRDRIMHILRNVIFRYHMEKLLCFPFRT